MRVRLSELITTPFPLKGRCGGDKLDGEGDSRKTDIRSVRCNLSCLALQGKVTAPYIVACMAEVTPRLLVRARQADMDGPTKLLKT
eukprot:4498990-Pleurochrysis_carterae.AAC.1